MGCHIGATRAEMTYPDLRTTSSSVVVIVYAPARVSMKRKTVIASGRTHKDVNTQVDRDGDPLLGSNSSVRVD